ncbi:MAG: ABC transporter permease [Ignavibacteriales bacterium]|nr:ABC transporter permease [Ignavibacteriales bacterium]
MSLLLVFVVGIVFHADGTFLKWETHRDLLRQISVYGILSCGMTLVIISGGIDLSVGSVMALAAVLFSLFTIHQGWPTGIALIATVLTGALCGMISGGVVSRFKIQPFIATMAMMVFARGVAKLVSGGQKISTAIQQPDGIYQYVEVPRSFDVLNARILGDNLATVTLILAVCVVSCWILLSRTSWGRHLYAIGGNEEAAWYAGIPLTRMKISAYGLSGLFCAVAGICQAAQELQGDPEVGVAYELSAIAMVVIGGTSLRGGTGTIGLTVFGILIIGYLEKILSINAVGEEIRLMLTGLIIVVAALFQMKRM